MWVSLHNLHELRFYSHQIIVLRNDAMSKVVVVFVMEHQAVVYCFQA